MQKDQAKRPYNRKTDQDPVGFFYFTDKDLADLDDQEFEFFWSALGKVLRSRINRERKADK